MSALEVLTPLVTAGIGALAALLWPLLRHSISRRTAIRRRTSAPEIDERQVAPPDEVGREQTPESLDNLARDPIAGPRFYVAAIDVREFRCFDAACIDLHHPGEQSSLRLKNVNLILGDNGSGKSTVLKAIAITALGPVLDSSGFVPFHLVRSGRKNAALTAEFLTDRREAGPRRLLGRVGIERMGDYEKVLAQRDEPAWEALYDESDPAFLVVGYGTNRRVADDDTDFTSLERSRRRRRYQRVASLFDESAVLTPLSSWLPNVRTRRGEEIEALLGALLPEDTQFRNVWDPDTEFTHRGVDVPYRALSDGYKSFIGWIGDLLFQIDSVTQGSLPYTEVGGIVLVDEVDLLLHPSWQRVVVPNLAKALPHLQFVFTSHSPIIAGTLEAGNIIVARENPDGTSRLERVDASIHGLNAEQILLSSYFELESTRAPGVQDELHTLAKRAMEGDDEAAVSYLRTLAGKSGEPPDE